MSAVRAVVPGVGDACAEVALVARSLRGEHTENWHFGAAAVVTPDGRLVARVGNPDLRAFVRSTAKPIQLLPLLVAGGRERFDLTQRELAVMCSSHCGTDEHVETVADILKRGEYSEADLECGSHPPLSSAAAELLRERGEEPRSVHNNCSGQHAGSLLACRVLGLESRGYVEAEHPLHRHIHEHIEALTGAVGSSLELGVDGCQMPTYRLSLAALAQAYARLADPAGGGLNGQRRQALEAVRKAVTAFPRMLAGPGWFTTRLIEATQGRLVGKEGAEGYYAVAVRGPAALGVALKIADGTEACRDSVVLDLLRQLGVLSGAEFEALRAYYEPVVRNHVGDAVGRIVTDVELQDADG